MDQFELPDEYCVYAVSVCLPPEMCLAVNKFLNECPEPIRPLLDKLMATAGLDKVDNILSKMPNLDSPNARVDGLQVQFFDRPMDALAHLDILSKALQMCLLPEVFVKNDPMDYPHFFLKAGSPWCRVDMIVLKDAPHKVKHGKSPKHFMEFVKEHEDKVGTCPIYISPDEQSMKFEILDIIRQMDTNADEFEIQMQHVMSKDFKGGGSVH